MSRLGTLGGVGLIAIVGALSVACASTGAVPRPFPTPGNPPTGVRPRPDPQPNAEGTSTSDPASGVRPPSGIPDGYAIAGTALALRGAPYRNGGSDPSGFDCSGFIYYVFAQHGIRVPRTVSQQFTSGLDITTSDLRAGDLVFFSTEAPGASHVGMVIGGDEFVHAPSARGDVRVERISARYWASRYVGARRMN
jgi:cell wall-associated NlpC family hydrolase